MARILIVDDERDVLLALRQLLTQHGHETREATNGLAGLELFQNQFFDLVITDLKMPCMDGLSFLREMEKLDPAMPVIVLTAYSALKGAVEERGRGAYVQVAKPFKSGELLRAVAHVLDVAKSA